METHDSTKPSFSINGSMQVKTLKDDFLEKFGLGACRIIDMGV